METVPAAGVAEIPRLRRRHGPLSAKALTEVDGLTRDLWWRDSAAVVRELGYADDSVSAGHLLHRRRCLSGGNLEGKELPALAVLEESAKGS
jgi:hypothetical protein